MLGNGVVPQQAALALHLLTNGLPLSCGIYEGGTLNINIVRKWGEDNGLEVGKRGRLKPSIMEAYKAAHPDAVSQ